MNFTKEDYESLKTVEDKLYTACYCQFVRLTNREQVVLLDGIYKKTFHTEKGLVGGCQHCLYEGCKKLGKLYFDDKKNYEKAAKEAKNSENEPLSDKSNATDQKKPKKAAKTTKKTNKKK